jgi:hypothetical protein
MRAREVVWVSYKPQGLEHCAVHRGSSGWVLAGTLVRHFKEGAAMVTYRIEADSRWRTKRVMVEQVLKSKRKVLDIEVTGNRWYRNGRELVLLNGCEDVDLAASPVTNTLPIRRTRLRVGASVQLTAAWVSFPSLKIVPVHQGYERLGQRRYRYRSASGFKADLDVDDFGLVRRYSDFWATVDPAMPS